MTDETVNAVEQAAQQAAERHPMAPIADRRRAPRLRSLLTGIIAFDDNDSTMDCTVRNISAWGAKIVLPDAFRAAGRFQSRRPASRSDAPRQGDLAQGRKRRPGALRSRGARGAQPADAARSGARPPQGDARRALLSFKLRLHQRESLPSPPRGERVSFRLALPALTLRSILNGSLPSARAIKGLLTEPREWTMIERRKEPRQKSLLGGKAVFSRRRCIMDCLVRNISPHGALVVFPHTSLTPSEFMLHIPHRDETYSAKLIWRHHDRAGVILSETSVRGADRLRQAHPLARGGKPPAQEADRPGSW